MPASSARYYRLNKLSLVDPVMNLVEQARRLSDNWSPRVVGQINDQYVKVAKVKGELAWHKHDREDEMFLILAGRLRIEYGDRPSVDLEPGDMHIVPRGVMHNPTCDSECLLALIEPMSTQHTGDTMTEKTVSVSDQLADF